MDVVPAPAALRAGGVLTIDLVALRRNYQTLRQRAPGAECAAVVKADAYGLGAAWIAPALRRAGCRTFFVAHVDEGIALRGALAQGPVIAVLHGPPPGTEALFVEHDLVPVLNSLEQIAGWRAVGRIAYLHVDTGMSRFGLAASEVTALADDPALLRGVPVGLVMSHLACADTPAHAANPAQLALFERLRARLPPAPASLAASSGIFLGGAYHFDMVRPGAALYGIAPDDSGTNPMAPVMRLQGCVAQVRSIPAGATVGYGATYRSAGERRIATVAAGYADGFARAFSNRGAVWLRGTRLPIVGRVSMDSITVDVTDYPGPPIAPGALVDLIGPDNPLDAVAAVAGTIGYELLTSLGRRYERSYIGA